MIGNPYKGRSFKGLLKYLHEGRKGEPNPHRVLWSEVRNLPTDNYRVVAGIMSATTSLARSAKKPVYHLPISWPPEEQPPKEIQIQVAETLIEDLGLSEHEHMIVAHDDGDCPHIHIVVNTVHPQTGKVWNAWRDVYRIMDSLERQEKELGLRIVDRPDLEEWRTGEKDPDRQKKETREERKRAEREGDTPLAKWSETKMREVRNNITGHFKSATSWEELDALLQNQGLELRRAGQGFRITDGEHYMTLSKVGKHARQERLEERFGQLWEDYEIDREFAQIEQGILEPPDAQTAGSLEEALEQEAKKLEAVEGAKIKAQLDKALLAAERYEYFKDKETQAWDAARRHRNNCNAIRRVHWIKERIAKDLGKANAAFDDMAKKLYRNPRSAWAEIERRVKAGEDFDEIDLNTVGKKRGWKVFGFRTQGRKEANEALKALPKAWGRIEKLRSHWEVHEHDELVLQSKRGATEEEYNRAIGEVGHPEVRRKQGLALWAERNLSIRGLSEGDIWQSELEEAEKYRLARAWADYVALEQRRDRKDRRNDNVRDFYGERYVHSQQGPRDDLER